MSIFQEYEEIRKRLGEKTYRNINLYLDTQEDLLLSDIYYSEEEFKKFEEWEWEKETKEIKTLYKILFALRIEDIDLDFDKSGLIAKDNDNKWKGKKFYYFLVDEVFVFEDNDNVLGIREDLLADFKELCKENKIEFKCNRVL